MENRHNKEKIPLYVQMGESPDEKSLSVIVQMDSLNEEKVQCQISTQPTCSTGVRISGAH